MMAIQSVPVLWSSDIWSLVNFWVVPISLNILKLTIYPEFDLSFGFNDWTFGKLNHPVSLPRLWGVPTAVKNVTQKKVVLRRRGENYANGTLGCFNPSPARPPSLTKLNFAIGTSRFWGLHILLLHLWEEGVKAKYSRARL